jgi:hypothetical protein
MSATEFKGGRVTRGDILESIKEFNLLASDGNDCDEWQPQEPHHYALVFGDKLYPPRHILSDATGITPSEFGDIEATNRVFRKLGFEIIDKP